MKQSSILSAKFDCPVARQKFSLLTTAHDCEKDVFRMSDIDYNSGYISFVHKIIIDIKKRIWWSRGSLFDRP